MKGRDINKIKDLILGLLLFNKGIGTTERLDVRLFKKYLREIDLVEFKNFVKLKKFL